MIHIWLCNNILLYIHCHTQPEIVQHKFHTNFRELSEWMRDKSGDMGREAGCE